MIAIAENQLDLFRSIFRGREDVYARRWEKNGKSGYSPAYDLDWEEFNRFRVRGGSFKDFKNKRLIPLTREVFKKHLIGQYSVGIYPILTDNTSWFIAADFDGSGWKEDCRKLIGECAKFGLQSYGERSRSGNGGHVWIFFENPYPCSRGRRLILELIRRSLKFSEFDKEVSWDRLFPNQDSIGKEGLGNLIALPLQGQELAKGNSVFLNSEDLEPFADQWSFLQNLHRHPPRDLDDIYSALFSTGGSTQSANCDGSPITLVLNNKLVLQRSSLTKDLKSFLREKLNFINTEYLVKHRLGKSVYGVEKFFRLVEEKGEEIRLPRGFMNQLLSFFKQKALTGK